MLNEFVEAVKFAWAWVRHIGWPWLAGVIGAVFTWLGGALQAIGKPGVFQLCLLSGLGGLVTGGVAIHSLDQKSYDLLKARYEAQDAHRTAAVHQAADAGRATQAVITQASGAKFERTRTQIVTQTETIIKEVPTYVTVQSDALPCNSVGLVRVLNAAAEGRSAADLELPPGVTDDTCTSFTNAAVAASVAANYGIARLNAGQLDGLIEDVKKRIDAANGSAAGERVGLGTNEVPGVDRAAGQPLQGSSQVVQDLADPVVDLHLVKLSFDVGHAQIGVDRHAGAVVVQAREAFLPARPTAHAVAAFLVHAAAPDHHAEAARPLWFHTGGGGTGSGEWLGPKTIFGPDRFGNYTSFAIDGWYWSDHGARWLSGIAA